MAEPRTVPVVTQAKVPVGELTLPESLFGGPVRRHLLYETVKMQRANRRAGSAATKTRGAVSGGGKKPWRQKGTGRARAGSSRNPLWRGGGTAFGPKPRDYSFKLPGKVQKGALRSALSLRAGQGGVTVVKEFDLG